MRSVLVMGLVGGTTLYPVQDEKKLVAAYSKIALVKGIIDYCDVGGRVLKLYTKEGKEALVYHYEGSSELTFDEKAKLAIRFDINRLVIVDKTKSVIETPTFTTWLLSVLAKGWRLF